MSKITKFRQRFATFKLQLISHNIRKRIRDAALSTFIHHYTFAAKSKSIKYDSRRTIRVGMETIPCTTQ